MVLVYADGKRGQALARLSILKSQPQCIQLRLITALICLQPLFPRENIKRLPAVVIHQSSTVTPNLQSQFKSTQNKKTGPVNSDAKLTL